jgi:uncharacterized protein (DUF302 family)
MGESGLAQVKSRYSFSETLKRLDEAVSKRGLKIFSRFDHAAEASASGLSMHPTMVLVFGSPRAGTPLMAKAPSLAIDLPLKILVAEDPDRTVWLTYSTPEFLIVRHGLSSQDAKVLGAAGAIAGEAAA